jgi:hypothetical protein
MSPATGHSGDASELQSKRLTDKILRALSGIRYGSVEIIVHEGRVVQIERPRSCASTRRILIKGNRGAVIT